MTTVSQIKTRATELLGIRYPIVQGGLARIAKSDLAAAVSNAGGLGQIAVAGLTDPIKFRAEIKSAKEKTPFPFGVNFPIGHLAIDDLLDIALEENVSCISFTGGNPKPYIARCEGMATNILVLVSGPEHAKKAEQAGAHIVATVGFEGGGHIGKTDLTTMVAVPLVVRAVSIPVLAGGGIADGFGLAAAMALGADGVEIGTRFIAVKETSAHENYKQKILNMHDSDTVIIKRTVGMPGRAIKNDLTSEILDLESNTSSKDEVLNLVRAEANDRGALRGNIDQGLLWAGQSAALIDDIPSTEELIKKMVDEANHSIQRVAKNFI